MKVEGAAEKLYQLSTDEVRELAESQWEWEQDQLALKECVNQFAKHSGISIPDSENVLETIPPLFDDLDPKQIRQLARDWLRDYYLPFAHLCTEEQKMLARDWLQILSSCTKSPSTSIDMGQIHHSSTMKEDSSILQHLRQTRSTQG